MTAFPVQMGRVITFKMYLLNELEAVGSRLERLTSLDPTQPTTTKNDCRVSAFDVYCFNGELNPDIINIGLFERVQIKKQISESLGKIG